MRRQYLTARAPRQAMLDVASRLCGVHAQLHSSSELTLWARVEGLQPGDVARALWDERTLVKTWAMRGTLHLFPSDEYGLWQAALSTRPTYDKAAWWRYFGLSYEELAELYDVWPRVLEGQILTREELAAAATTLTGTPVLGEKMRESWGTVLKPAAYEGRLCVGPGEGRNTRFTSPRTWLGPWEPWAPHEALLEITRRYLAAHAPATREDVALWWSGGGLTQAGKLLKELGDEVAQVDVEGEQRYMLAQDVDEAAAVEPGDPGIGGVRLLPAFDQWVVTAPRRHDAFLASQYHARVYRPQGWLSPVLLVDGHMAGTWSYSGTGERLRVTIEPFDKLPVNVQHAADGEAERLAGFLRGDVAT